MDTFAYKIETYFRYWSRIYGTLQTWKYVMTSIQIPGNPNQDSVYTQQFDFRVLNINSKLNYSITCLYCTMIFIELDEYFKVLDPHKAICVSLQKSTIFIELSRKYKMMSQYKVPNRKPNWERSSNLFRETYPCSYFQQGSSLVQYKPHSIGTALREYCMIVGTFVLCI